MTWLSCILLCYIGVKCEKEKMFVFSEVTIKQLRERLREGEEKVEAVAEVTSVFTSSSF